MAPEFSSRVTGGASAPPRLSAPPSKMSPPDAAPEILDSEDDGAFNDDEPSLELSVVPQPAGTDIHSQLQTVTSNQHGLESPHVPTSGGMFFRGSIQMESPGCV